MTAPRHDAVPVRHWPSAGLHRKQTCPPLNFWRPTSRIFFPFPKKRGFSPLRWATVVLDRLLKTQDAKKNLNEKQKNVVRDTKFSSHIMRCPRRDDKPPVFPPPFCANRISAPAQVLFGDRHRVPPHRMRIPPSRMRSLSYPSDSRSAPHHRRFPAVRTHWRELPAFALRTLPAPSCQTLHRARA